MLADLTGHALSMLTWGANLLGANLTGADLWCKPLGLSLLAFLVKVSFL